jgi:serine/threonine protein kinase
MGRRKEVIGAFVIFSNSEVTITRKISESLNCQTYLTDKNSIVKFYDFNHDSAQEYFNREVPVYQIMSPHPNLASYQDHSINGDEAFLHLEYYPKGDFNYVMAMKKLQISEIRESILDLCTALQDLHGKGIFHLDLRPENVLLSNEGITKICDFGSALRSDLLGDLLFKGKVGEFIDRNIELSMQPPELRSGELAGIGPWTDMWQLGCLIFNMIFAHPPFPNGYSGTVDFCNAPKGFKGILDGLLDSHPDRRMTAYQVIQNLIPNFLLSGKLSEKRVGFIEKIVSRSTKKLVSRILSNDESLHLHEISRLVYKASKKPFKVGKFLEVVQEKLSENILPTLKTLALLHMYTFKVPLLMERFNEKLRFIIHSMLITWNFKSAEKQSGAFSKYFAGFIKQYCRLFLKKIQMFEDFQVKFNWSNMVINNENIELVLDYLEFCLYLLLGISFDSVSEYFEFRQEIIKIIINEISIVVLIFIKAFQSTMDFANHRYSKFKKVYLQVKGLCDKKFYQIFLAGLPDDNSFMTFKSFDTSVKEEFLTEGYLEVI